MSTNAGNRGPLKRYNSSTASHTVAAPTLQALEAVVREVEAGDVSELRVQTVELRDAVVCERDASERAQMLQLVDVFEPVVAEVDSLDTRHQLL